MQLGDTRSMEIRATMNNVFNTVQYAGVDTNRELAELWAGDFGGGDAGVSIYGEVQVLSRSRGSAELASCTRVSGVSFRD